MASVAKIATDCFEKKPDGSWVALKNSDIVTQEGGFIRISPGMTFKPGRQLWGLDVVQVLENTNTN